ncbi:hypothetical protein NDU88_005217 [Pleurodeles waltl]|uniref:Uncharacterized protein n=1 Tax=Pleurodeles waltl TaxID=8319 RepID=A0AAV7TBB4_PLEWA|nr:hypothetical protein NDU88_005217 [Pleurodeles waltl]
MGRIKSTRPAPTPVRESSQLQHVQSDVFLTRKEDDCIPPMAMGPASDKLHIILQEIPDLRAPIENIALARW